MAQHAKLVEMTAQALSAGLPIDWSEQGIATWLTPPPSTGPGSIPVYFTERLWERLNHPDLGETGFRENVLVVLSQAKAALVERVIGQHAWRTAMQVDLFSDVVSLWLIVNHGHSDGIAIGFGSGDFW